MEEMLALPESERVKLCNREMGFVIDVLNHTEFLHHSQAEIDAVYEQHAIRVARKYNLMIKGVKYSCSVPGCEECADRRERQDLAKDISSKICSKLGLK